MQTTYEIRPSVALPGMRADSGFTDTITAAAESAIPAGRFVVTTGDYSQFLDGGKAKLPSGTSEPQDVLGVSLYLATKAETSTFAAKEAVPVMQRGRVWLGVVKDAVIDKSKGVFVATSGDDKGKITAHDADGALRVFGARTLAVEEGLALVDVNLPSVVQAVGPQGPPGPEGPQGPPGPAGE